MATQNHTAPPPRPDAPLTDPADLLSLAGRFFGSIILSFFALLCLVKHEYGALVGTAAGSLFLQWMTVRQWRRLRDERIAAKAARGAQTGPEGQN